MSDEEQNRRIKVVEDHQINYNKEMGEVQRDLAVVRTDVSWLKKYFWVVIVSSTGALTTAIINLIN